MYFVSSVVDLYLVHSPMPAESRLDTWKAMEDILRSGKAKAIGVSNYGVHHLKELFANCKIRPSVNQVEQRWSFTGLYMLLYFQPNLSNFVSNAFFSESFLCYFSFEYF